MGGGAVKAGVERAIAVAVLRAAAAIEVGAAVLVLAVVAVVLAMVAAATAAGVALDGAGETVQVPSSKASPVMVIIW